eukprot:1265787-Pyramimonas_sp.AAC.1
MPSARGALQRKTFGEKRSWYKDPGRAARVRGEGSAYRRQYHRVAHGAQQKRKCHTPLVT